MSKARKVVVTGAARGLGAAIAERFAAEGAQVLRVDIRPEVDARSKRRSRRVHSLVCDLSQPDCGERVIEAARSKLGGCDTLIHNAAWTLHVPFLETNVQDLDRVIAVNQRAPFLLTQAFVRWLARMKPRPADPCVVHISSINAVSGNPRLVAYAGTKGALEAMTRALAVELASRRIRVNAVRPAAVDTEQFREALRSYDPRSLWRDYVIPSPTPPADVAAAVAYLCSPAARHVTGAVWTIDGGYMAH